jgi:hypothetical protein
VLVLHAVIILLPPLHAAAAASVGGIAQQLSLMERGAVEGAGGVGAWRGQRRRVEEGFSRAL